MDKIRVAVMGAGAFGKNHLRVLHESAFSRTYCGQRHRFRMGKRRQPGTVAGRSRFSPSVGPCRCRDRRSSDERACGYRVRPTEGGVDVLVEKPIAADLDSAQRLIDAAEANGRILQVGHLERFNPAVQAVQQKVTLPLFFEIHRMSMFSPRSLDVDVVLDLMIHDIDVVLALTGLEPEEIRAAGIRILSDKVDIANVRLAFPGGYIANLTASRVSTEKIRKYVCFSRTNIYPSIINGRMRTRLQFCRPADWVRFVSHRKRRATEFEIEGFLACVRTRSKPVVSGEDGLKAPPGGALDSC